MIKAVATSRWSVGFICNMWVFTILLILSTCHAWTYSWLLRQPPKSSQTKLYSILGNVMASNKVLDRQTFLADAFWLTAGSLVTAATPAAAESSTTMTNMQKVETTCRDGALMGESAVPGAYSSACMGLPERIVPLPKYRSRLIAEKSERRQNGGDQNELQGVLDQGTIVVQQKTGGSGNTGMTVWNSGLLLTRLLDALVDELEQRQTDNPFWRNQDVIELGCGTGLCSIAAHRLGANSVMATDGNPGVLELADKNIRQNCYDGKNADGTITSDPALPQATTSNPVPKIKAQTLQWGFLDAMDYSESASFIIGADLTYNPGSWRVLAETIATVLKTKNDNVDDKTGTKHSSNTCYALYLSVGHDGFNVNAEMDGFLSVAKEVGLINLPDGVEGIDPSQLLLATLSDSERKILAQGGGFRVAVLGRKNLLRL